MDYIIIIIDLNPHSEIPCYLDQESTLLSFYTNQALLLYHFQSEMWDHTCLLQRYCPLFHPLTELACLIPMKIR